MDSYLIINADDFGYSRAINYGIIDSFNYGVLTSTTMMANMPGFQHGVSLAKKHPNLGIGVHLTLTAGKPITRNTKTLTKKDGSFKSLDYYERNEVTIDQKELYDEWKKQIEKIIQAGISPTHLDSHHHINILPELSAVFFELAREYKLPVRGNTKIPDDVKTTNRFLSLDSLAYEKELWKSMNIDKLINDCQKYTFVEAMCHPGYVDSVLLSNSSFTTDRTKVVDELMNDELKGVLLNNNIKLINFKDLEKIISKGEEDEG